MVRFYLAPLKTSECWHGYAATAFSARKWFRVEAECQSEDGNRAQQVDHPCDVIPGIDDVVRDERDDG